MLIGQVEKGDFALSVLREKAKIIHQINERMDKLEANGHLKIENVRILF